MQLEGLPSHIALTMANVFGSSRVPSEDDFSRISNRISWKEKQANNEWSGFALSSPYYARSVLRQLGMLEREFIKRTISDIISWSLERATDDLQSWVITDCEYVRHIFQRLAKKELYVIPGISDKRSIADDLFIQYGNSIVRFLLHVNDGGLHAKWAGTFSSLGICMESRTFGDNPDGVERVVLKLCNEAISLRRGRVISDGRVFVPLMRALSRMCKNFGDQQDVRRAALAVRKVIDLYTVLDALAADGDPDFERRANVTLLSYVEFLSSMNDGTRADLHRKIFGIYKSVERKLSGHNFRFDAGNATKRAQVVLVRGPSDMRNIRTRAQYLLDARRSVHSEAREQGTWKGRVDDLVRRFERRFGSLEGYVSKVRQEETAESFHE